MNFSKSCDGEIRISFPWPYYFVIPSKIDKRDNGTDDAGDKDSLGSGGDHHGDVFANHEPEVTGSKDEGQEVNSQAVPLAELLDCVKHGKGGNSTNC